MILKDLFFLELWNIFESKELLIPEILIRKNKILLKTSKDIS